MNATTTFAAFTPDGRERIHVRRPGKVIYWIEPDGTLGLGGVRLEELLPWGAERLAGLPVDVPVVVTEGEKSAAALIDIGIPAVGTFGASAIPMIDTLKSIATGRRFVLWPDEDEAGHRHMELVGQNLYGAGATTVFLLSYRPTAAPAWPAKHDAADLVAAIDGPVIAREIVVTLVEDWAVRIPRVLPKVHDQRRPNRFGRLPSSTFRDASVSAALRERFGIQRAAPGRTVRCPRHDDRVASLSILADDGRAICWSSTCAWATPGVTATDIEDGR